MKYTKQFVHINWLFKDTHQDTWMPATVPGCVHTDLLDNKIIENPFYQDNESRYRWIEYKDWEYKTNFQVNANISNQSVQNLVFEGLDTYASVYLNQILILKTDNMYRTWRVPVKEHIKVGDNELKIIFKSATNTALTKLAQHNFRYFALQDDAQQASTLSRKAPFHYGWDWGPRFVSFGIWKSVYLEAWSSARINHIFYKQDHLEDDLAILRAEVELDCYQAATYTLNLMNKESKQVYLNSSFELKQGQNILNCSFEIANPQRWWPQGFGEQVLYLFSCSLLSEGEEIDKIESKIGLRTAQLRQEKDKLGESFEFLINDVPIFIKGANWIPADSFLTRVTEATYETWIKYAKMANFNMLRVWGGGIYEQDIFYEKCDEYGILVWQDFMFACSLFPSDDQYLENIKQESIDNVKRIRNHASLVLWCGDNENEWIYDFEGQGMHKRFDAKPQEIQYFKEGYHRLIATLKEVVQNYDPTRYFWPSSPSSEGKADPNSNNYGDIHHWDIWHMGQAIENYRNLFPRFISEFGFQGMPHPRTVQEYTQEQDLFIGSPVMAVHQKHARGYELIRHYMDEHYPSPKDFQAYVYLSQVQQADYIKLAAEHFRSLRPRCMGILYWQYNDCWPVCSWASVDYYFRWKALHYFAKKFYAPVLVYPVIENNQINIKVISDEQESRKLDLTWRVKNFQGEILKKGSLPITVKASSSTQFVSLSLLEWIDGIDLSTSYLTSELKKGQEVIAENKLFFTSIKNLTLAKPAINYSLEVLKDKVIITLHSSVLAKNVFLDIPKDDGFFSDNYFDLEAKQSKVVEYYPQSYLKIIDISIQSMIDMIKI